MDLPFVGEARLRELISMKDAIDAVGSIFAMPALPTAPARQHLDVGPGELLVMPSWGSPGVGVKLVSVNPANPGHGLPLINGVYVLMDEVTLVPKAIIDGAALTGIRTAAVSGLATRYLADPDSSEALIFGAGTQADAHLDAMVAELPLERVRIVSRTLERAERLADEARAAGIDAAVGRPEDAATAHVICACTTSHTPLFDGSIVGPGAHVNAVGTHRPDRRELDATLMGRASVVVETLDAALREAGEVVMAIDEGALAADDLVELAEVVRGRKVRRHGDEITVFKSVGVAFEDLAVARAVADRL